jgi:histone arginine demethylase JMJD6
LAAPPGSPPPYLRNVLLEKWIPELMADISPLPLCTAPNWLDSRLFPSRESQRTLEIYIGGAGARFPMLHYDGLHTHAWLMQIHGRKRYLVYPPSATALVYPRTGLEINKSSIADLEHPDLERFPLFAQAEPTVFDLHPGETLFVPSGFWHTVAILSPSITISINSANRPNWGAFVRDFVQAQRRHRSARYCLALRAYLVALGWTETAVGLFTGWSRVL